GLFRAAPGVPGPLLFAGGACLPRRSLLFTRGPDTRRSTHTCTASRLAVRTALRFAFHVTLLARPFRDTSLAGLFRVAPGVPGPLLFAGGACLPRRSLPFARRRGRLARRSPLPLAGLAARRG